MDTMYAGGVKPTLLKTGVVLWLSNSLGQGTSIVGMDRSCVFHALAGQLNHQREEHQGERCLRG